MEANERSASSGAANRNGPEDQSVAELVKRLSEQSSLLARQEVELAKAEVTEKGKRLGIGAGAFGGAGLLGLYALGALTATLILALATFLEGWIAALIVTVVYAAVAGAMALAGKKKIDEAGPPVPERAIATTKRDVETMKSSAKEGRR